MTADVENQSYGRRVDGAFTPTLLLIEGHSCVAMAGTNRKAVCDQRDYVQRGDPRARVGVSAFFSGESGGAPHETEADCFSKAEPAEALHQPQQVILLHIPHHEAIKRRAGHDTIYRFLTSDLYPCNSRHLWTLQLMDLINPGVSCVHRAGAQPVSPLTNEP